MIIIVYLNLNMKTFKVVQPKNYQTAFLVEIFFLSSCTNRSEMDESADKYE